MTQNYIINKSFLQLIHQPKSRNQKTNLFIYCLQTTIFIEMSLIIISINFNALNFVCNLNSNNTIILNIHNFCFVSFMNKI